MIEADARRLDISVSVSYDSDIKKVKEILGGLLEEDEGVLKDRDRTVFVDNLANSGIIMGVRCYTLQ